MHMPIILDALVVSIRSLLLAALLLVTGCHVSPKTPRAVAPLPSSFTYWYSSDQRETLDYFEKPRTFVNIDGRLVEYTECVKAAQHVPFGRWTDYKLIGTTQASCTPF